jgi:UDP-2,3-diacylglucosamine pyrophosphatase LpxH
MFAKLYSDLHLEFMGPQFNPGSGDVLVLAGDILTARNLNRDDSSPKRQRYLEFLNACSQGYKHVIYVAGNHEHYGYDITRSQEAIRNIAPANVHFMERDELVLGDWVFLGATLWTNLKNNDPMVKWDVERYMNDFRVIRVDDMRFTTDRWWAEHFRSFQWLDTKLAEHKDKKVFVVTHHAPSVQSIHERYLMDRHYNRNYGYFTDLDEWIIAHPQIKYWTHGHVHNSNDYIIGATRVVSNPRGYFGTDDMNPQFDPDLKLDLT